MKKLILLTAVLIGTAAASQAGVSLNVGFGFPFPHHGSIVIGHQAPAYCPPAPVVVAPRCETPVPVVVAAPRCEVAPVVVIPQREYYYSRPSYGYSHHGWDRGGYRGGHSGYYGGYSGGYRGGYAGGSHGGYCR